MEMDEILLLRSKLTPEQMIVLQDEYSKRKKSPTKLLLCWLCTLGLGGHRFYLGDYLKGFLMLITLGGIGIWSFLDMFWVSKAIMEKNQFVELTILKELLGQNESLKALSE